MLSISGKNWIEIYKNKRLLEKIKLDHNFEEIIAKIIISRKFTESEILTINNDLKISNPFLNNSDFLKSIEILNQSIINNDKIIIIGDYDVDGCVSTSLFVNFFKFIQANYSYYIPNRFNDGYGATRKLIEKLSKERPGLIIMLDCGSNSKDAVNYLNNKNIKSLVIDHHEIYRSYPNANVIINPKKECEYNEYDYFSTGVLCYFFLDLFIKKNKVKINLHDQLIFVLLTIVCDVMPLRKINRVIALNVLKNFNINNNFLFKEIFKIRGIKRKLEIEDLGFLVGPLLNSAGRLEDANIVVELLTNDNISIKKKILNKLILLNEKRKKIENDIFKKILINKIKDDKILFFSNNLINEGIIGIVASKLQDLYELPSIVLTKVGKIYKGSARSNLNFNIGLYIKEAIDRNIALNGGGHNLAAGFTISSSKLLLFKKFIVSKHKKKAKVDQFTYISKISIDAVNKRFLTILSTAAPFGEGNHNPNFLIEDVSIIKPKLLKDKYLTFFIKSSSGKTVPGISFSHLDTNVSKNILYNKNKMSLIVQIKENQWNNKKSLQLIVLDIIKNPYIS